MLCVRSVSLEKLRAGFSFCLSGLNKALLHTKQPYQTHVELCILVMLMVNVLAVDFSPVTVSPILVWDPSIVVMKERNS